MKKKIWIMALCAALVITSAAMGTIAYLTDRTSVANVFTIGDVRITVDEAKVNKEGVPVDEEGNPLQNPADTVRVIENAYHLIPGVTYTKDPTMTVFKGSEDCYVRMMVTVTSYQELMTVLEALKPYYPLGLPQEHVEGWQQDKWIYESTKENTVNNTVTYEFRYHEIVKSSGADQVLEPLFTAIVVPSEITSDQLAAISGLEISVEGHAIQTATFENADAAWAAFDDQELAE